MEEKPKRSSAGWYLGLIGLAAAGGLGYYAWELRAQDQELTAILDQVRTEKRLCDDGLKREQLRSEGVAKELAGCSEEGTKVKSEKLAIEKLKSELEANLNASHAELEELRRQRAQTEARLQAFRALTDKFRRMIDTGQIKVLIRDGRMVMKLPEGILFASGSAELSDKGKVTLQEVAANLKSFPERNFMVAGHTDDVQLAKGAPYRSNWELSTARSVTVTEFLIGSGMRPQQLVAAGYSQYDPVSSKNKQENRRIEIVLLPSISELPQFPEDLLKSADSKSEAPPAPAPAGEKAP